LKRYTLKEAAETWGVKETTLRQRLFQDTRRGYKMHGSRKYGGTWIVTDAYMKNREWRNRNHEDRH
jgi:hypothetical protein